MRSFFNDQHPWQALRSVFVLLIITSGPLNAQQLPLCQGGENLASSCANSCVVCDLDGYSNSTMQVTPGDPPPGFCTFVVHNIGWVGFIAGSTDLTISVEVFSCSLGNSIEMGIYQAPDCQNAALVSNCNTEMFQNNTYSFTNTEPLIPGCVYFLVFDNNGPAICPFTVTVTSGSASAPNPGPTPAPSGPTEICPGATATYSIPPVFGTCEYTWTAPAGSLINGQPSPASVQGDQGASVEITFGSSAGNVCVETGNLCAGNSTGCLPVTLAAIPPTILPPISICNGTSLEWIDGEPYSSSQIMSTTFLSWLGCDSVVTQQLIVRPPITTNLGTLFICPNECIEVAGIDFCASGLYQVTLSSYLDCDSTVIFSINQVQVNAVVAVPDTIDCLQSSVLLNGSASTSNSNYSWYNSQNMLLGTNNTLTVSLPGVYMFLVKRSVGAVSCQDTAWTTVIANFVLPPVSAVGDTLNCQGDSLLINGSSSLPNAVFSWTGPGIDSTNQHLEDPLVVTPGLYVLTVLNPDNGCQASDTTTVTSIGTTPPLSVPMRDTVNCFEPLIWLVAQPSSPGVLFSWMAPDSTLIMSDSALANQNGLWIALATGPGGCTNFDTTLVLLDTLSPLANATGGMLDCSGTPIVIQGSSSTPGATFSWVGPNNFSASVADTSVTVAGAYVLTVATPNGCTATATTNVLANTDTPDLIAGGWDTLNCLQTSILVTASSLSSGAMITWTGSGNFSAMGNSVQITSPGLYTATATTPNGCQSSINFEVPIDTLAPVFTLQGDTIRCNHPIGTIRGFSADPLVQYQWSGPGVLDPDSAQTSVNAAGQYILKVTGANGCSATAPVLVETDLTPPQWTVSPSSMLSCSDTSMVLWASTSDLGVNFVWSGPNSFSATSDTVQINTPGSYSLVATGLNGCSDSLLIPVSADTLSPVLTAIGGMINCAQTTVQLSGQTNTPGLSFLWSGPNGFSSTLQNPTTTEAGTYQLLGTASNGCSTLVFTAVMADFNLPTLSLSSSIQTLNCIDTLALLQVQSDLSGTGFQWLLQGVSVGNSPQWTTDIPGAYTVVGTAPNGCSSSNTLIINQDIVAPDAFASGGTLFCQSASVQISGSTNTSGALLQWSGPGNFNSIQDMPLVSLPGNYVLTVTSPNGCTATAVAQVLPDDTAPDLMVQPASAITCANPGTTLMAVSGTSGVIFSWTGPNNFAASGASVQTQTAGLYTVQALAPNGCSTLQTITITTDTLSPLALANGGTLTCQDTLLTLVGSSNTPGVTYLWSGPNNFSSATSSTQVSLPGSYLLTLTAPNGCTGTATAQVLQNILAPDLSLSGNTLLTCTQTTVDVLASSTTTGVSWNWSGPGNFSATSADISVGLPGTYQVTATAPNGCSSNMAITVDQNINPPTALAVGGALNCSTASINLSGQSNDPGALFTWVGPGQFTANGPMPLTSLPGAYTLNVTGANGCTAMSIATVTADQTPPVFSLSGNTITCTTPVVNANASGFSAGTTFNWAGPAGFQQTGVMVMISAPGAYQVTAQGANGCTATNTISIGSDTQSPQIDLEGGILNCRDTAVQILATVSPAGAQFSWYGPQQNLPANPQILVSMPGLYTLIATAGNGCTAESEILVEEIVPTWSVELGPDQTVWEGTAVFIQAVLNLQKQDISDITWTPGIQCSQCLYQSFKARDSMFLQIAVEDKFGCIMTDNIQINVRKRGELYVPNVFSPDGDGNNDEFQVFAGNPATLIRKFQVFDRWGSLVFMQEDFRPDETRGRWDGFHRGQLLRPAVFIWTLEVEYEDGTTELLSGDVLLKL